MHAALSCIRHLHVSSARSVLESVLSDILHPGLDERACCNAPRDTDSPGSYDATTIV